MRVKTCAHADLHKSTKTEGKSRSTVMGGRGKAKDLEENWFGCCKRGRNGLHKSPLPWVNNSTSSEHFISLKCSSLLALYLYATEEDILVLGMKWKVPLSVNMDGSRSPFSL